MNNTTNNILLVFLMVLIFYLLSVLSSLLIPFILAFLSASLFQSIVHRLLKKGIPKWLILPVVVVVTLIVFYSIFLVFQQTVAEVIAQEDYLVWKLDNKIDAILTWVNNMAVNLFNTHIQTEQINQVFDVSLLSGALSGIANVLSNFSGSFFIFIIYYIVLLASMSEYKNYLAYVGGENVSERLIAGFEKVQKSIFTYIVMKTLINIGTGVIVFVVCLIFGIKFALFWGFLAFLLNFIPTIGSLVATVAPLFMAIIQFDSFLTILLFLVSLVAAQNTMGNLIEPMLMGNQLKLNTLTVIFGLVFWGYLWGVPGMILSVPMMVILKLIFEQFPNLQIVARIMGSPDKAEMKST